MPRLPTLTMFEKSLSSLLVERQQHVEALAKIDALFTKFGITVGAAAKPQATEVVPAPAATQGQKRRRSKQTASEFVFGLLEGGKSLATAQINAAWREAGRSGRADRVLMELTKAGRLKKAKLGGQRGSNYNSMTGQATAVAGKPVVTKPAAVKPGPQRGKFAQTGEQFVLELLHKNAMTGAEIEQAWKKDGRRGAAANILSVFSKGKKVRELAPLCKERGF